MYFEQPEADNKLICRCCIYLPVGRRLLLSSFNPFLRISPVASWFDINVPVLVLLIVVLWIALQTLVVDPTDFGC